MEKFKLLSLDEKFEVRRLLLQGVNYFTGLGSIAFDLCMVPLKDVDLDIRSTNDYDPLIHDVILTVDDYPIQWGFDIEDFLGNRKLSDLPADYYDTDSTIIKQVQDSKVVAPMLDVNEPAPGLIADVDYDIEEYVNLVFGDGSSVETCSEPVFAKYVQQFRGLLMTDDRKRLYEYHSSCPNIPVFFLPSVLGMAYSIPKCYCLRYCITQCLTKSISELALCIFNFLRLVNYPDYFKVWDHTLDRCFFDPILSPNGKADKCSTYSAMFYNIVGSPCVCVGIGDFNFAIAYDDGFRIMRIDYPIHYYTSYCDGLFYTDYTRSHYVKPIPPIKPRFGAYRMVTCGVSNIVHITGPSLVYYSIHELKFCIDTPPVLQPVVRPRHLMGMQAFLMLLEFGDDSTTDYRSYYRNTSVSFYQGFFYRKEHLLELYCSLNL